MMDAAPRPDLLMVRVAPARLSAAVRSHCGVGWRGVACGWHVLHPNGMPPRPASPACVSSAHPAISPAEECRGEASITD